MIKMREQSNEWTRGSLKYSTHIPAFSFFLTQGYHMQLRMSPDPLPGIINTFIGQADISIFRVILKRQNSELYVVSEIFLAI